MLLSAQVLGMGSPDCRKVSSTLTCMRDLASHFKELASKPWYWYDQVAHMDLSMTGSESSGSWLRVADMMGSRPEMAVLRRFRKLNILRLLEMQSNLALLEEDYEAYFAMDAKRNCPTSRSYMKSWTALEESEGLGDTRQRDAWKVLRNELAEHSMYGAHNRVYWGLSLMQQKIMPYCSKSKSVSKAGPASMILVSFVSGLIRPRAMTVLYLDLALLYGIPQESRIPMQRMIL